LTRPGFDPATQPVIPAEPLAPLSEHTLQLDFIRRAFDQALAWQVEPVFADVLDPSALDTQGFTRAAVFMPLVQRKDGLHMLFTRRTAHLAHHAGQISFPGGRIEASDADAIAAALRETHEETGIAPRFAQVLGTQPSMLTATQFFVTPVVFTPTAMKWPRSLKYRCLCLPMRPATGCTVRTCPISHSAYTFP